LEKALYPCRVFLLFNTYSVIGVEETLHAERVRRSMLLDSFVDDDLLLLSLLLLQ